MKKILLLILICFTSILSYSQLPYSWIPGTDPGWTTTSGVLRYRTGCNIVTTNCTGNYTNNINSSSDPYTSPIIDATCNNASTVAITFTVDGNAESGYDFLFIEYSLNGGSTWINPLGVNVGYTGNTGGPITISPIVVPTSPNLRFRFYFISDNTIVRTGYKISDFDIVCNIQLPVELSEFNGTYNKTTLNNDLYWITTTERNNDYFTIERSENGTDWTAIHTQKGAGNSETELTYNFTDTDFNRTINYYRLSQIDIDGKKTEYEMIAIDNTRKSNEILKVVNTLGQEVNDDTKGVVYIIYVDGTTSKIYR